VRQRSDDDDIEPTPKPKPSFAPTPQATPESPIITPQPTPSSSIKPKTQALIIAVVLLAAIVLLSGLYCFCLGRNKEMKSDHPHRENIQTVELKSNSIIEEDVA